MATRADKKARVLGTISPSFAARYSASDSVHAVDIMGALVFHSWTCTIARRALEHAEMDPNRIRIFKDVGECCRASWGDA